MTDPCAGQPDVIGVSPEIGSTEDLEKMPGGRPPTYQPEFAKAAESLVSKLKATDQQVADFLEVDRSTFYRWRHEHEEFRDALIRGKKVADATVERTLYERATGYSFEAVKIFMPAGADAPVYAPYTEHVPPDTTAAIFWLKNRKPKEWRDRREIVDPSADQRSAEHLAMVSALMRQLSGAPLRIESTPVPEEVQGEGEA